MTSIQDLIAESRLPGQFAEKRSFTFARKRAIEKMRQFALADPYFFVLELVQAAVANGATYISVDSSKEDFVFAYTGASYTEEELSQLFDFLLVGRARPELERVHGLALGVNALLRFEPESIEIVSGAGSHESSVRAVVAEDALEIGRPTKAIAGTFVKVTGMRRSRVETAYATWREEGLWPEYFALEERCLSAPVPILYNMRLLGTFSTRIPPLAGYRQVVRFDEGDLYGSLGAHLVGEGGRPMVKLLTHGVWIESVPFPGEEDWVGGVVCFDSLHKTIDHAAIVRDERWDEMWYRLRSYVDVQNRSLRQVSGLYLEQFDVYTAQGRVPSNAEAYVSEARAIYVSVDEVPPEVLERDGAVAVRVRESRDVLGIRSLVRRLRRSAGGGWDTEDPDAVGVPTIFVDDQVLRTVLSRPAEPLRIPDTLVEPMEVGPVREAEVARRGLEAEQLEGQVEVVVDPIGSQEPGEGKLPVSDGRILLTAFAPQEPEEADRLVVVVRALGRPVWRESLTSRHRGMVLVADYLDAVPRLLLTSTGYRRLRSALIHGMVRTAEKALTDMAERIVADALDRAGARDEESRRLVQWALVASVEPLLHVDPEVGIGPMFVLANPGMPDRLLDAPVFQTLKGTPVSLRRLARMCAEQEGLVYGVVEGIDADLEGLDQDRILKLSPSEEDFLVGLMGTGAYVRVDRRDVLAETPGGLRCRDLALGLRQYPDFPLLVEPAAGAEVPKRGTPEWREAIQALVRGLLETVRRVDGNVASGSGVLAPQEDVRNVRRHLQWLLARAAAEPELWKIPEVAQVAELYLFDAPPEEGDGGSTPAAEIRSGGAWASLEAIESRYSWYGVAQALTSDEGLALALRRIPGADDGLWDFFLSQSRSRVPKRLLASPFEARLLARVGRVNLGVTEVPESLDDPEPFLGVVALEAGGMTGLVGLTPAHLFSGVRILPEGSAPSVEEQLTVAARRYGVTAAVSLEGTAEDVDLEAASRALEAAAKQLLDGLVAKLLQADGSERERLISELLGIVSRGVELRADAAGQLRLVVTSPLVTPLLDLELVNRPDVDSVTPRRLVQAFVTFGPAAFRAQGGRPARYLPLEELPPVLRQWVTGWLVPARVSTASDDDLRKLVARWSPRPPAQQGGSVEQEQMCRYLASWLRTLRTDLEDQPDAAARKLARFLWGDLVVEMGYEAFFADEPRAIAKLYLDADNLGIQVLGKWTRSKLWLGPGPTDWNLGSQRLDNPRVILALNPSHWLVRWAAGMEPEALAALAAAVYGFLNDDFAPGDPGISDLVTDAHELSFLRRLGQLYRALREEATGPGGP